MEFDRPLAKPAWDCLVSNFFSLSQNEHFGNTQNHPPTSTPYRLSTDESGKRGAHCSGILIGTNDGKCILIDSKCSHSCFCTIRFHTNTKTRRKERFLSALCRFMYCLGKLAAQISLHVHTLGKCFALSYTGIPVCRHRQLAGAQQSKSPSPFITSL